MPFQLGDRSWHKAQVTAGLDERSYMVEAETGTVYQRNQQHLRKTPEPSVAAQPMGNLLLPPPATVPPLNLNRHRHSQSAKLFNKSTGHSATEDPQNI